MESLALYLSAPIAGFRAPHAREYLETLPCPPPSTVYGALLSLVGETRRARHSGVELAIAMLSRPQRSVVLRSVWRIKEARALDPGQGENVRPDYQELLVDVRVAVWVRPGKDEQIPSLVTRLAEALRTPASVDRFGGLALGESTHLVDEARELRDTDGRIGEFLVRDGMGSLTLPVWPDHVGSAGTGWQQLRLEKRSLAGAPHDDCGIRIEPMR